jgi:predicted nucleic acid-binding protein
VLLDELADVFTRPHLAPIIAANNTTPAFLMQRCAMLAQFVVPAEVGRVVVQDIDDDAVVACALGAGADLIVSGDPHLLNLKAYHGIRIVPPAETLALIAKP